MMQMSQHLLRRYLASNHIAVKFKKFWRVGEQSFKREILCSGIVGRCLNYSDSILFCTFNIAGVLLRR